jgi:SAM-dependent methyltransferase
MSQSCRHCAAPLCIDFLDLGFAPPSNAYLLPKDLSRAEMTFPLRLLACNECRLVQTEDYATADFLFKDDYAYFSSTSKIWLNHAAKYADMIINRFGLGQESQVVEIACNDGYLLKNFLINGIPCLGVEPSKNTADAARSLGIPVAQEFFGASFASELDKADLIVGNNVFAHVPNINDFTTGLKIALKPEGVITLEFPHLMRLVEFSQFDTVYHEHFSYLSLFAAERIFALAGLRVFDVEELTTHGGSLRIYGCHFASSHLITSAVRAIRNEENARGIDTDDYYRAFQTKADAVKDNFVRFLLAAKAEGKTVAGYGAAAKGNTIINYAGIKPDLMPFICDAAEAKIGKLMPGSHIPIFSPSKLRNSRPDYVVILPWNIATEIQSELSDLKALGTTFVTAVPNLKVLE